MGVDTIQINLGKSVDAVKLQAGVPKWLTNVENVFDGLGQLVGLFWFMVISAISIKILML